MMNCIIINPANEEQILNLENSVYAITLNNNCTISFDLPENIGTLSSITIFLSQDNTGDWDIIFPQNVYWESGSSTLNRTPNTKSILMLFTIDSGTTWYVSILGTNY